jgi:hypothetical protein
MRTPKIPRWSLGSILLAGLGCGLLLAASVAGQTYYSSSVLNDGPLLYWSFDEAEGNALQVAPLVLPPVTTENDLVPIGGAGRVNHADVGGYAKLGRAAELNGTNYFQALTLRAGIANLNPPWAVEFWMQVAGPNTDNRADYLMNFGTSPDNAPAFIYDFNPDQLEIYTGVRTANGPIVSDQTWHHVVWVYYGDGASGVADRCDAWVDGVDLGNVRNTFTRAIKLTERLLVGAATPSGVNGFEGRLDEIAVYDLSAYADEAGVAGKAEQMAADHYLEATSSTGNTYAAVVLSDSPLLYWNFDEADGNALQKAPITLIPLNNDQNQLFPEGAGRIAHADIGSGLELGNALEGNGTGYFRADDLDAGTDALQPPWAVEFWVQVQGANTLGAGDRQDYLINFGTNPGGDNSPAFIYDYPPPGAPDQLEIFAGAAGRTGKGPTMSDEAWHHVLWVYYGNGSSGVGNLVEAYVDGLPLAGNVRNDFARALKLSDRILVGAALVGGVGGFEGRLDEVAVYNLNSLTNEAAVRTKVSLMASNHYMAAYGPPGNAGINILQQPGDVIGARGGTATFKVTATVTGAPSDSLTYQWFRNGASIAGATEASFTTPTLALSDLGTNAYSVRLGTVGGVFVLSQEAKLVVPIPPPAPPTYYTTQVMLDEPYLYWNFDEFYGNAIQQSPLGTPTIGGANDLGSVNGATRVNHADVDGLPNLGRAADLNGANWFQVDSLSVSGRTSLNAPWAMEFWMQATGDNSGNRADYLMNFGTNPDNSPAFIYDFKPDQLEIFGGAVRTDNGPLITDGNWHHVFWVFYGDGTAGVADRCEAWVDGVTAGNVRANYSRAIKLNERLLVGVALPDGANAFEGRLDEVAVYDLSGAGDAAAVSARVATMVSAHVAAAFNAGGLTYSEVVLGDQPLLYWNFDEEDGNVLQRVPIAVPPDKNDLVSIMGASRVEHAVVGSGVQLGNAADFSGGNFFEAADLDTDKPAINAPWAVEYWMQVQGPNEIGMGDRQDYLINFGTNPGGDNSPAFIYDYGAEQLEIFAGVRTGSSPAIIADEAWHHVLWVFYGDGAVGVADRCDAWVDGVDLGNVRNNFSRAIKVSGMVLVGAALPSSVGGFQGRMDEVAVYDLGRFTTEADVDAYIQDMVVRHLGAAQNPPPRLVLTRSDKQIVLSWSGEGFVLQENANLANPAGWTAVAGGGTSPVTLSPGTVGGKFYRLYKP